MTGYIQINLATMLEQIGENDTKEVLECEDDDRLINFYSSNGFVSFGKRNLEGDETQKVKRRVFNPNAKIYVYLTPRHSSIIHKEQNAI